MNDNNDNEIANLINFHDDETTGEPRPDETACTDLLSTTASISVAETDTPPHLPVCLIAAPLRGRESLDNNPFDSVQKLVNRPDDPFEIVEKEACFKARHHSAQPPAEVKLGKLLSLSDDNLLDDNDEDSTPNSESTPTERLVPRFGSDSTMSSAGSTIYHSVAATTINLDLDNESPPISMSAKWTPENSGSASSADGGVSGNKTRSAVEHRKRLLKLSITNSTFNSPVSRRMPEKSNNNNEEMGICGVSDDDACSPLSTLFSKASLHCNEYMLASESPLKLIGDDDLMSEEPPPQFLDAEKDFDADLEMLKIPMLKELPSPVVKHPPSCLVTAANSNVTPTLAKTGTNAVIGLSDLAAIRAKLRAKRVEANNNQDISLLIQNLKALICDIDDGGDNQKKQRASCLLESLSCALAPSPCNTQKEVPGSPSNLLVPQPIIRQGTFDMELQEKEKKDRQANLACAGSTVVDELSHMIQSTHSTHSVQSMPPFEDIPDAMIKSSATYDGEPAADRGDIVLPEVVNTISPPPEEEVHSPPQSDVNDIIEQLSKLLEHQWTQQNDIQANGGQGQTNAPLNPTFIVVMNSSSAVTHPPAEPSAKQRSSYVAQYMESSFNNGSPDLHNSSATIRRRTQSLSLHDKVKIVKLQMHPPPSPSTRPLQQAASLTSLEQRDSTPPMPTPSMDSDPHEFKTPSRMMPPRRNSFTSGTPYTPMTIMSARRSNVATKETTSRRSNVLSTHHERQQDAIVARPTSMPHATNLSSFKPDLKKKLKTGSSQDSIMKSSRPLKATIPVKKVAPMMKISPPTPSRSTIGSMSAGSARRSMHNNSMHSLTKPGKMVYTSTPMPLSRSAGTLGVPPSGYPNACSTPTVNRSPVRRISSASTTKPRYSYMSATPNGKPVTSAAAAAGLKRRTLSELRTKSPIKPRVSGIGGSVAASTSSSARAASRSSLKLPQNTSRSLNRTAQTPTASGRNSLRPSSTRSSNSNNIGPNKNKENKLP